MITVDAPHFIATKLVAFLDRGNGDFYANHDLEDIVTVVDGRESLVDERDACAPRLRNYVAKEMETLLKNETFRDALPGHHPGDRASQQRLPMLLERFSNLAAPTAG